MHSTEGHADDPPAWEEDDDPMASRDRHGGRLAAGPWGQQPPAAAAMAAAGHQQHSIDTHAAAAASALKEAEAMLVEMTEWQTVQMRALHRRLTGPCGRSGPSVALADPGCLCRILPSPAPCLRLPHLCLPRLLVLHVHVVNKHVLLVVSFLIAALEQVQDDLTAKTIELASLRRCASRMARKGRATHTHNLSCAAPSNPR